VSDESEIGGQCGQHVEVDVKEGMRETGAREGETRGTSLALAGDEDARPGGVVAGASIEAGVTKCVGVPWGRQRGVQRTKGRQQVTYSCAKRRGRRQTASGAPKPKEAAHRDVDYSPK